MAEFQIPANAKFERSYVVTDQMTAKAYSSGAAEVFATPAMIATMENTCLLFVAEHLPDEYTTVGTKVCVEHLSAAPVGAEVLVKGELTKQDDKLLCFNVEVWWNEDKLGQGTHERYVVHYERFMARTLKKMGVE